MILPYPLTTASSLQDGQTLGRVTAFVTAARTGLDGETVLPPYPDKGEQPRFDEGSFELSRIRHRAIRKYDYANASVGIEMVNGRIMFYHDHTGPIARWLSDTVIEDRKVSDAQAIALTQRFYTAAGWPGKIAPMPVDREGKFYLVLDPDGNNDADVSVHFVPMAGPVQYDEWMWQGTAYINRQTGQLDGFTSPFPNLPAPPASLVPRGSLDAARGVALRFGVGLRGETVSEMAQAPFRLRVWYPSVNEDDTFKPGQAYSLRARAAVAARRGILAYVGWVAGGSRASAAGLVVDATTGEIIDVQEPSLAASAGGGGSGTSTVPKEALAVPTTPRPWRVATGKAGWNAWTAPANATLTLLVSKPPAKGAKRTLTDGKAAFPATYDAKANLLGIDGKAYRPGPPLASLLRRKAKG